MGGTRLSTRFWDFTWTAVAIADGLQAQSGLADRLLQAVRAGGGLEGMEPLARTLVQTAVAASRAWQYMSDPDTRVVMVEPDQVRGLPTVEWENAWAYAQDVRPPFPVTYFDLGGKQGLGVPFELQNPPVEEGGTGRPWASYLTGVIFRECPDALMVLPILRERKVYQDGTHILVPATIMYTWGEIPARIGVSDLILRGARETAVPDVTDETPGMAENFILARRLSDICLPLLALLECVNVGLADAPLSQGQVRIARRKPRTVPLIVTVRRSTRRTRPSAEPRSRLTVQFEVMGNFKHHGPGTPVYRAAERDHPEKIRDRPPHGPCVRFWQPPHIRGPEGAPLILKARRIPDARRVRTEGISGGA